MMVLGLDTSNYTTSAAAFDGVSGKNCSRLLDVKEGELGLRQSDALFSHVKRLPELVAQLFAELPGDEIVSHRRFDKTAGCRGLVYAVLSRRRKSGAKPRDRSGCSVLRLFSPARAHRGGLLVIRTAWTLMDTPHLAWHLSGGTTELLLVTPGNKNVNAEKIGGTQDISAGQLIDRTGKHARPPLSVGKRN